MNNIANIVKQIITEQGEGIVQNNQRLRAFFSDYAKDEPKQDRIAFSRLLEIGAYQELANISSADERKQKKAALAAQLQNLTDFDKLCCAETVDLLETVIFGDGQPEKQQKKKKKKKLCAKCGKELSDEAVFCLYCGTQVGFEFKEEIIVNTQKQDQTAEESQPVIKKPDNKTVPIQKQTRKITGKGIMIAVVFIILGILLLIFWAWFIEEFL